MLNKKVDFFRRENSHWVIIRALGLGANPLARFNTGFSTRVSTKPVSSPSRMTLGRLAREAALVILAVVAGYLLVSLLTHSLDDPGWSSTGHYKQIENGGGRAGAWLADLLFSLMGYMAYLVPLTLAYKAWGVFRDRDKRFSIDGINLSLRLVGMLLVVLAGSTLLSLPAPSAEPTLPYGAGGIVGGAIAKSCLSAFSILGSALIFVTVGLFGLTILFDISWFHVIDESILFTRWACRSLLTKFKFWYRARKARKEASQPLPVVIPTLPEPIQPTRSLSSMVLPKPKQKAKAGPSERAVRELQPTLFELPPIAGEVPSLGLLNEQDHANRKGFSQEKLESMSRLLETKLKDFGVDIEVVSVQPGPVITRFEVNPAPGVKVSRISNLAKDLARSLSVISVRVVEVIPGKPYVGIEIPNDDRAVVSLREVLSSQAFENSKSPLTLALGHDISGNPLTADLAKMPHLLVAGTTGSGKSVGVNAMLLSLLFKSTPAEVRLILIDPKMLELSIYEGIPHLLAPVVTDMKDAANALRWCVAEMERRYKLMAAMGVRNLAGFNRKIHEARATGEILRDPTWKPKNLDFSGGDQPVPPELEPLPCIVVVIDEFADMMMIVGKKVEELIARIAQKARAAGIHLILATQRPSVDVITGLIKANIPTRIGFQVSSRIDSRTILDQGGAEQLLGHGDMLYLPPGTAMPVRVHGAFVADEEVHRVVEDWKRRGQPEYIDEILEGGLGEPIPGISGEGGEEDPESDALYDEAVKFVTESRKASISAVQRKLRIGYNRAARLIETMEAAGVVTAMNSNGSREVMAPPAPRD